MAHVTATKSKKPVAARAAGNGKTAPPAVRVAHTARPNGR